MTTLDNSAATTAATILSSLQFTPVNAQMLSTRIVEQTTKIITSHKKSLEIGELSSEVIIADLTNFMNTCINAMADFYQAAREQDPTIATNSYYELSLKNINTTKTNLKGLLQSAKNTGFDIISHGEAFSNELEMTISTLERNMMALLQNADYFSQKYAPGKLSTLRPFLSRYLNSLIDFLKEAHQQLHLNTRDEIPPNEVPSKFRDFTLHSLSLPSSPKNNKAPLEPISTTGISDSGVKFTIRGRGFSFP